MLGTGQKGAFAYLMRSRVFGTVPAAYRYPADNFRYTHEAMGHVDCALSG
jgi:hypothetical protein